MTYTSQDNFPISNKEYNKVQSQTSEESITWGRLLGSRVKCL